MRGLWIYFLVVVSGVSAMARPSGSPSKVVVCYLGSWANYRRGEGKFLIEDIDPSLCTHLVYGFAKLGHDNRIQAYDSYLDLKEHWGLGAYDRFTGLKSKHPHLKTLLAIGGWNEGSTKYSRMAKSPSARRVFVESCVRVLASHSFDGLDLDWEYPGTRGGGAEDKGNFIVLLKELKEAFQKHNLMLTAAVSAGQNTIDVAYDIPALGKYLDLINLMAYDFHGGWDKTTGHNSPLYPRPDETGEQRTLNVDYAVKYWLRKGAPASKLVLGMPLYGRSFALRDPRHRGFNASITGKGAAGEFTREQGFMGYNEICKMLQRDKEWRVTFDKHVQAPFVVKERQWIGYDDVKSLSLKTDYLLKMKLAGAMVWSLETDDFRGKCHGHRYPLLQAINSVLNGTSVPLPDLNTDNTISYKTTWNFYTQEQTRTTLGIKPRRLGTTPQDHPFLASSTSPRTKAVSHRPNLNCSKDSSKATTTSLTSKPKQFGTTSVLIDHPRTSSPNSISTNYNNNEHTMHFLPSSTTPEAVESTPRLIGTTDNPRDHPFNCPTTGYFRHTKNCTFFYVCQLAPPEFEYGYLVHLFSCGTGTVFNQEKNICDHAVNVLECSKS